jgi:hypothetical protein
VNLFTVFDAILAGEKLTHCKLLLTARNYLPAHINSPMGQVYEIHKYRGKSFLYVVARTNKHSEDYVKGDIEKMNGMLTPEMRSEDIRYVFALGTVESMSKKAGDRTRKKDKNILEENAPAS